MNTLSTSSRAALVALALSGLPGCAGDRVLAAGGRNYIARPINENTFNVFEVGLKAGMNPIIKKQIGDENMPTLIGKICGPAGGRFESTSDGANYSALLICGPSR